MNKKIVLVFLCCALVVGFVPTDAKAETSFSFSISDGYHGRPHHHGRHHPHHRWHRPHYYPPVVYGPPSVVYVQPTPVVYQTSVVRAPVKYVEESSFVADSTSPTYYNTDGQLCREYQSTAWVSGRQSQIYGTACLQPDGAWRVVD